MCVFYLCARGLVSRSRLRKHEKITVICPGFPVHQFCNRFSALLRDMRIKKRAVETAMKVGTAGRAGFLSARVSADGQLFFAGMAGYHDWYNSVLEE